MYPAGAAPVRPRRYQVAGGATSQAEHTSGARADARSDRAGASLTLARLAALGPLAERRGSLEKVVLSPISGGRLNVTTRSRACSRRSPASVFGTNMGVAMRFALTFCCFRVQTCVALFY